MTTYPSTTLVGEGRLQDFVFTASKYADAREECCADLTGAQGPVDLVVDATAATSDITVTLHSGDGPTATFERRFEVRQGSCKCVPVSTGESAKGGGMLHFTLESKGALVNAKPRVAIVKHRYVETH